MDVVVFGPGELAIDHAGRVIVVGMHLPSDSGMTQTAFVRKYDSDGGDVWAYDQPFVEDECAVAWSVALDATEHAIIVGHRLQPDGGYDAWVAKLTP